jgi:hypothetical protein
MVVVQARPPCLSRPRVRASISCDAVGPMTLLGDRTHPGRWGRGPGRDKDRAVLVSSAQ